MWFAILTPGAHPSRATPTVDEVTVLAWTGPARLRIDGPAHAVHGGLRVLRRQLHEQGTASAAPRCFVCREPVPLPDAAWAREDAPGVPGGPEDLPPPDEQRRAALAAAGEVAGGEAALLYVELPDLGADGADPSPGEEEALVVLPELATALLVPLAALPSVLPVAELAVAGRPRPTCGGCGEILPAGVAERDAADRRARRAARTRRGRGAGRGGRRAA